MEGQRPPRLLQAPASKGARPVDRVGTCPLPQGEALPETACELSRVRGRLAPLLLQDLRRVLVELQGLPSPARSASRIIRRHSASSSSGSSSSTAKSSSSASPARAPAR